MLCAAAIVLTVSLLSCQKDESDPNPPQTQEEPTIAIEVTAAESDHALYTITVEHAEQAYFLTLESDMTEPTDEMISQIGTRLSDGVNRNLRAEGLTASTSYTVYALAIGADGKTARDRKEFLTADVVVDNNSLHATTAMGVYYGCTFSENAANYYFMLTDCPFQSGVAQGAGKMVYFDCYGPVSDTPSHAVIPTGKYTYEDGVTHEQFRISNESTVLLTVDESGKITDNIYFSEGELDITSDPSGSYTIEGRFVTRGGEEMRISYTGTMELTNQSGVYGEDITVETTYAYSDMTYYGDAYGAGFSEYYFRLGDMTPDSDGNPLGSGYVLDFDLWGATSADADNAVLPEGTYTFSSDIALNTIAADKSCGHYTLPDGSARYRIDYKEGTATVKHTADGYEISGHFVLEDGYRLNFSYKGALTFKNMAPAVSEDINEVFATGEGSYYGDLYGYGTANYTLTFTSSDGKTVLMIDMNDVLDESHDPVISEGTYTLDENGSAAAGKYYEGVIDMWGPMGTYCTINAGTDQEEYLLVNGGTFTVTHKEPGYGFTFDFTTQGGTKVQGSYDGEFKIIQ